MININFTIKGEGEVFFSFTYDYVDKAEFNGKFFRLYLNGEYSSLDDKRNGVLLEFLNRSFEPGVIEIDAKHICEWESTSAPEPVKGRVPKPGVKHLRPLKVLGTVDLPKSSDSDIDSTYIKKEKYDLDDVLDFIRKEYPEGIQCFSSRNTAGDYMETVYNKDGVTVDFCGGWMYIEVFGLTEDDYLKVEQLCDDLQREAFEGSKDNN